MNGKTKTRYMKIFAHLRFIGTCTIHIDTDIQETLDKIKKNKRILLIIFPHKPSNPLNT